MQRDKPFVMTILRAMLAVGLIVAGGAAAQGQPQPGYFDIPPGFDFPANKQTLGQFRASGDLSAQRLHVWNVFAGMTQPTPDGKYAIFETWYSSEETFQSGPSLQATVPRRVVRRFAPPRQFDAQPGQPGLQAAGSALFSEVMFNYANYKHVRDHKLYLQSTLDELKQTGTADPAIPNNRTVPAFPNDSVSLKTVWWPVKKTGMTVMPIWDSEFNPIRPAGNPMETWARVVAVDPSRQTIPPGESTTISFAGTTHPNAAVVSLSAFHYFQLDQQGVDAVMANPRTPDFVQAVFGRPLQVGDYVAFVGTHLTTKEIDDWVWATFWWHDRPTVGAFAADRPAAVKGVWRNYLMSASYDLELPREIDGTPHTTFNPWLEAGFVQGIVSNCMNCHNRAGWRPTSFRPIFRGKPDLANDPAYRAGQLRTDFLWSLPFEAKQ
jgi:hypothetical protein